VEGGEGKGEGGGCVMAVGGRKALDWLSAVEMSFELYSLHDIVF